jgi:hypothetical protein
VNRFMERYRTGGHRRVRSREVQILMVERLLLKKKKEYERRKKKGAPVREYRQKGVMYDDAL